jgi:hypothetical protein
MGVSLYLYLQNVYLINCTAYIHFILWLLFRGAGVVVSASWDTVMDWGLLAVSFENKKLKITQTSLSSAPKFAWVVINFFLRLAFILNFWLFTNPGSVGVSFNREFSIFFLSLLEIGRRGVWTTLKMENDHFKAVKKLKAVREIHGESIGIADMGGFLLVQRQPAMKRTISISRSEKKD